MLCFLEVQVGLKNVGIIRIELFSDDLPITCLNFKALCTGEKSTKKQSLSYKSTKLHKIVKNFMVQGGDVFNHDGKGSNLSIYGPIFKDESFKHKHNQRGLLSMVNRGPNTNSSQFFITFNACPWLDNKNVVFAKVFDGWDVLDEIEKVSTDSGVPKTHARIINCGVVELPPPVIEIQTQSFFKEDEEVALVIEKPQKEQYISPYKQQFTKKKEVKQPNSDIEEEQKDHQDFQDQDKEKTIQSHDGPHQ